MHSIIIYMLVFFLKNKYWGYIMKLSLFFADIMWILDRNCISSGHTWELQIILIQTKYSVCFSAIAIWNWNLFFLPILWFLVSQLARNTYCKMFRAHSFQLRILPSLPHLDAHKVMFSLFMYMHEVNYWTFYICILIGLETASISCACVGVSLNKQ